MSASSKKVGPVDIATPHGKVSYCFQPPQFQKGRETSPSYLEVQYPCASHGAFSIWAKSTTGPTLAALGFYPAETLGNPELDGRYVYAASDWGVVSVHLKEPRVQGPWKRLADIGFTHFEHDGETLTARWIPYRSETDPNRLPFIPPSAAALADWARQISPALLRADPGRTRGFVRWTKILNYRWIMWSFIVGLIALAILAGLAHRKFPLLETRPFADWLIVLTVASYALTIGLLRRQSRRHLVAGRTITFAMGFGGIILGALWWALIVGMNGALDGSPPAKQGGLIVDRSVSKERRGRTKYHVVVESWKEPGALIEFSVSRSGFDKATPGESRLELSVRAGWLGLEWIERRSKTVLPGGRPLN